MKCWIGEEREGFDKGKLTLFVQCRFLTATRLVRIAQYLSTAHIYRVYIGAGKKDIITYSAEQVKQLQRKYIVVAEVRACNRRMRKRLGELLERVIVRIDNRHATLERKEVLKIDTGQRVSFCTRFIHNTLADVKGGLYTDTDEIIKI